MADTVLNTTVFDGAKKLITHYNVVSDSSGSTTKIVDVSELKLGNSIMQTGLALPEGVELSNTLLTGQDQPVVSCTTTRASLEIEEEVEGEISEAAQDEEDSKEESSDTDKGAEEDNS